MLKIPLFWGQSDGIMLRFIQNKLTLILIAGCVVTGGLWLAFDHVGGVEVSKALSERVGQMVVKQSRGRVLDPTRYIHDRLREGIYLVAVALLLTVATIASLRGLRKFVSPRWICVPLSLIAFVAVNVWVGVASNTAAYWIVLVVANSESKQPAFQLNRIMLRESDAPVTVAIHGSSQGKTEIDSNLLNKEFGPGVVFSNLSYAGSRAIDHLLVARWYDDHPPTVVVCYLSEFNLYSDVSASRFLTLLTTQAWPDVWALQPQEFSLGDGLTNGYCGSIVPAYQSRRSIEYSVFGTAAVEPGGALLSRSKWRTNSPKERLSDTDRVARKRAQTEATYREVADTYTIGANSDFHKRSLERFLAVAQSSETQVMLIAGQVNPQLSRYFPRELRSAFLTYLHSLPARFPNVQIIDEELPAHVEADYDDAMHISEKAQRVNTARLADLLEERFGWQRAVNPE